MTYVKIAEFFQAVEPIAHGPVLKRLMQRSERGRHKAFSHHILQANEGCDFDFLETGFGASAGEPAIF